MSELGDVLELLHGAHSRYTTARLEARERRRYRLQNEAYERARRRYSNDVVGISYGSPVELPEEGEATIRGSGFTARRCRLRHDRRHDRCIRRAARRQPVPI